MHGNGLNSIQNGNNFHGTIHSKLMASHISYREIDPRRLKVRKRTFIMLLKNF